MSNAITRTRSGNRLYHPPPMRRHQQQQQQQVLLQKQLQMALSTDCRIGSAEVVTRSDSDDSTLYNSNSVANMNSNLTNLDRLVESVSPSVPAQCFDEALQWAQRTRVSDTEQFFCLGDLWESFKEWSVYGVGVPLLLSGGDAVKQYYVPSLSGIQLYVDPCRLRRHVDDNEAESSRETSCAGLGASECEAEQQAKSRLGGVLGQGKHMNSNFQGTQSLNLKDNPFNGSSREEPENLNSPGCLVYEYFEQEQPHNRKPLYDKVSTLASQFPDIRSYRSCDLLPSSWVSVAWYPIYRIPVGRTLQSFDASFLTLHALSTHAKSKNQVHMDVPSGRKLHGTAASPKIVLPVFGLASYKLRGSILTSGGVRERQQADTLLQAADSWLRSLEVKLPDFQFFVSHNS